MKALTLLTLAVLTVPFGAEKANAQGVTLPGVGGLHFPRQVTDGFGTLGFRIWQLDRNRSSISNELPGGSLVEQASRIIGSMEFVSLDLFKEMGAFRGRRVLKQVIPELDNYGMAVRLGLRLSL